MRIRGCLKPVCSLCMYCEKSKISQKLFCKEKQSNTESESSCQKFKYDIFKYTPTQKNDLGKFSREDFEI